MEYNVVFLLLLTADMLTSGEEDRSDTSEHLAQASERPQSAEPQGIVVVQMFIFFVVGFTWLFYVMLSCFTWENTEILCAHPVRPLRTCLLPENQF